MSRFVAFAIAVAVATPGYAVAQTTPSAPIPYDQLKSVDTKSDMKSDSSEDMKEGKMKRHKHHHHGHHGHHVEKAEMKSDK